MLKIEVKGLKELNNRINHIIKGLPKALYQGIDKVCEQTSKLAIIQAPENTGRLKSSIKYEVVDVASGEVKGRIYSDINIAPYALWVNYGTGVYAEGEGGSRAEKIPWFVHESMANLSNYGFQTWTAPTGDMYYIIYGIHATHFMDSAEFIMRKDNVNAVINEIKALLKG